MPRFVEYNEALLSADGVKERCITADFIIDLLYGEGEVDILVDEPDLYNVNLKNGDNYTLLLDSPFFAISKFAREARIVSENMFN
jgi:hypothetical protein